MGRKLLNSVRDDGCVRVRNDKIVTVVCLLKADSFQESKTSVNLGHARLNCAIIQVYLPEFLVLRILLNVFHERCNSLKASLSDSRCPNIRIQRLNSLNSVFHELSRRLLIRLLCCSNSTCTKPLTLVSLKDLSHTCLFPSHLRFLSFL